LSLALALSINNKHNVIIHRETDRFFAASGVQFPETDRGQFHFLLSTFSTTLKEKVGGTLTNPAVLRITLNIDGVSITSRTHTHPSHSQTSRLFTSSLSLRVPVPIPTSETSKTYLQCCFTDNNVEDEPDFSDKLRYLGYAKETTLTPTLIYRSCLYLSLSTN
jgi:hypothetical protein